MDANGLPPIRFDRAVPQFTVPDVRRAAEYYRDVLGFEIEGYWKTPPVFAIVQRDGVAVYFHVTQGELPRTGRAEDAYDAYFHVTGVDRLAAEVRARGAEILDGPATRIYGRRELVVRDCNGLVLAFGEPAPEDAARMAEMVSR